MKKTLLLILCLMTSLLLAACSGTPTGGDTTVPTVEPTQAPGQPTTTPVETAVSDTEPTATLEVATPIAQATAEITATAVAAPTYVDDSNGMAVPLDTEMLKNSSYRVPSGYNEDVTLVDGEFRREDPTNALYTRLLDDKIAYGDIDGDGLEDAAIILVSNTGGSGNFVDLLAVSGAGGIAQSIGAAFLGDRVAVQSITIVDQQVIVNMITQGPNDPSCCPTLNVTATYELQDGELKNINYVENGTITPTPVAENGSEGSGETAGTLTPQQVTLDVTGVDSSFEGQVVPEVPRMDGPGWRGFPEHLLFGFNGQPVEPTFVIMREGQLRIFPVQAYLDMFADEPVVAERVTTLQTLLADRPDLTATTEDIPAFPIFNATQVLHAKVSYIDFDGGTGVGFITQYSQAANPVVSTDLAYTFQGLTDDGQYLITYFRPLESIEGFPDTVEDLPADIATQIQTAESFEAYIANTVDFLNSVPNDAYTPNLDAIVAMLQTLKIG